MAASVPLSLALRHTSGQGWSETYHYVPALGVPDAADVSQLAQLRGAMLTKDVTITHARVGTSVKRLVQIFPLNGGVGYSGQIDPPTAPLECAILFILQAPGVGYNRIFVRGFDSASVNGEALTPSSAFSSAAGLWENYLFSSGLWNVKGALGSSPTQHKLTLLAPTPPRGISFDSTDNLGGPGTVVTIHRATVPGYNGRKTILSQALAAGVYSYTAGGAAPAVLDPSTNTFATIDTFYDSVVTQVNFVKVTRRGVGRPFGLLRGRRPTTYSLRP